MPITITQRPEQSISGETSYWNAVGNPIVYKLQRKDFTFNQVNNVAGFVQLQFNSIDLTGSFAVNDEIYVASDNAIYDSIGLVTAESFAVNTLITTNIPYTSAAPGGFVNNDTLRSSYRIFINLYTPLSVLINEESFVYSTSSKGLLLLNVSGIIRPSINPNNDVVLTTFGAFDDTNPVEGFVLGYTEYWSGSAESETVDGTTIYAVFGARQIPSAYGGNLADYSSWNDGGPMGKWLTRLTTPVMWRGWPFTLGAIINEGIVGNIYVDAGSNTSTPAAFAGKIIQAVLTGVTDSVNDSFTVSVKRSTGPTQIVETKTIEVREACQNPIMLMAKNSYGGPLQWLFDFSQDVGDDYGDDRKARRKILFANNLTSNEWDALQEFITLGEVYKENILEFTSSTIKTSTRIGQQVYAVNQDGTKVGVIVIPTKNITRTKQRKHSFEIEIEYPEEFTA
jgi:hypothetical protein